MKKERKTGKMENEGYTQYITLQSIRHNTPWAKPFLYKNIFLGYFYRLSLQENNQDGHMGFLHRLIESNEDCHRCTDGSLTMVVMKLVGLSLIK